MAKGGLIDFDWVVDPKLPTSGPLFTALHPLAPPVIGGELETLVAPRWCAGVVSWGGCEHWTLSASRCERDGDGPWRRGVSSTWTSSNPTVPPSGHLFISSPVSGDKLAAGAELMTDFMGVAPALESIGAEGCSGRSTFSLAFVPERLSPRTFQIRALVVQEPKPLQNLLHLGNR